MGFFSRLFGAPASQSEFVCGAEPKFCVVDTTGLTESAAKNGATPSPRDNFEALKALTQFAAQEGVNLAAVFTGRPLREASDGVTFKNVKVHYAENTAACRKTVMRLAQTGAGARGALVITADAELERMAAAQGADCMRISTFKKALDNREGQGRDRESRDNRRQSRPPRRSNGNATEESRKEKIDDNGAEDTAPVKHETSNQDDSKKEILDLIDPI